LLKSVYSMMLVVKINFFLYKMEAGKNGVGNRQERGRERERGKRLKGVGDRVYVRIRNGMG
jgi:hypothetical protein